MFDGIHCQKCLAFVREEANCVFNAKCEARGLLVAYFIRLLRCGLQGTNPEPPKLEADSFQSEVSRRLQINLFFSLYFECWNKCWQTWNSLVSGEIMSNKSKSATLFPTESTFTGPVTPATKKCCFVWFSCRFLWQDILYVEVLLYLSNARNRLEFIKCWQKIV